MTREEAAEEASAFGKFTYLLIAGVALVFVGIIILLLAVIHGNGTASFGGIIFIGPIPILFGAGPDAALMIIIATILAVISILLFFMSRREIAKAAT